MDDILNEFLANPIVHMVGIALLVGGIALWLAAAWWTYQDASRRTESSLTGFLAAGWIVMSTPLTLPLSLAIYMLARPQATASDDRTQRLVAQLNEITRDRPTCPGCEAAVDPDWLRCPFCATWFAVECPACGEWSAAALALCPFCGEEREPIPAGWAAADSAGHGMAAAGEPEAAGGPKGGANDSHRPSKARLQRGRMASSWRPSSYAASRARSSVSS